MAPGRGTPGNRLPNISGREVLLFSSRSSYHLAQGPELAHLRASSTSDLFLGLVLPAFTLLCSYDNFRGVFLAYKGEWLTGVTEVVICIPYMLTKLLDLPDLSPALLTLKSWIRLPTCPARDTGIIVTISYLLLVDINLSYLWLAIFPVIAIAFIYVLHNEVCRLPTMVDHGEVKSASSSTTGGTESNDEKTTKKPKELELILMVPLCSLLVMELSQFLDKSVVDRFVISPFLLFLSSMLGALTRMMMRLPTGASPASDLLHKTFLLLLLVTTHTMAAEWLGEDVVLMCMPEVVPMLLWFSIHLDRDSSITTVDKIKPYINVGAVVALVFAYLATFIDESGLSGCKAILVSCSVSGLLTNYVVFMLRQWPGQQAAGKDVSHSGTTEAKSSLQSEKQAGKDHATISSEEVVQSNKPAVILEEAVQSNKQAGILEEILQSNKQGILEEAVQSNKQAGILEEILQSNKQGILEEAVQSNKQADILDEAVQLLKFWANILLTAAAALLALTCRLAVRAWYARTTG